MKVKIGILVRSTLPDLISKNIISEAEIKKLQREDYCKLKFDLNYPILKQFDESKSKSENCNISGYSRYYSDPVTFNGKKYIITNDWYDRNQESYVNWLMRLKN